MLRLYAGRENIDKERFIYDSIKERGGETLVLVPNQYTLAAEEQALEHLGSDCLFDVEILSMNRLGLRVLMEQGRESVRMLDKYGRFMLLTRLIKQHASDFEFFRLSAGKLSFTSMLSDFVSEFKQQNCNPAELASMAEDASEYPMLSAKIKELSGVIDAYKESIKDIYKDPEDYIAMYVDAIKKSKLVAGKQIWIYGYDSVTPKFASAMMELAKTADDVNLIINRSDFGLDEMLESTLERMAASHGIETSTEEIDEDLYRLKKSETIEIIEKYLWREPGQPGGASYQDFVPEDLTLVCAANPYYEAENAAAFIWHLVRDLGYRMRDIQVIANDEGSMQPIVRRVFAEYGLPLFSDATRDITDTAAVGFIVNLLWFELYHRAPQFLFAMLKSGMSGFSDEDIEELENYVRAYHIKGSMWDREFKYGEESLGEEVFARVNSIRAEISSKMKGLADLGKSATVSEFVNGFKTYLEDEWKMSERLDEAARDAEDAGYSDEAQRLTQSYDKALSMLDQMIEILGGEKPDLAEFTEIYIAGLSDVEVGVIPATEDGLSLGTMIRTRPRRVKACVVLGACEGVLPMQPKAEGLFSVDEKAFFKDKGFALGSLDDIKMNEENAAMYRLLSSPAEKLYISYALTDTEGKDASPSPVIEALDELFPQIKKQGLIKRDIISGGWSMDMLQTADDAMRHLAVHMKDRRAVHKNEDLTQAALKWYSDHRKDRLDLMAAASGYDNVQKPLGRKIAAELFTRGDSKLTLSSSKIGTYFDCPFKYYVSYGLRPTEERDFKTDSRSVGDAYHECLMAVASKLLGDRELMRAINEGDEEALAALVDEELSKLAEEYRGGLFISTGAERYRLERIKEICAQAASAMAAQLGTDALTDATFEEVFGRHGVFEPIHIKSGDDEIFVEGRIDRADTLSIGGGSRIRVIDYKTGSDSLDTWKMAQGYKMQLMIYLISAATGDMEPAGMFYFNIKDPIEPMNKKSKSQFESACEKDAKDYFKLKGAYIDEEGVLPAMPKEVLSGNKKLSRDEYMDLRHEVMQRIEETGKGILKGDIDIHPLRTGSEAMACSYCSYKSVCRRDGGYAKNYSRKLKRQPKKTKEEKEE